MLFATCRDLIARCQRCSTTPAGPRTLIKSEDHAVDSLRYAMMSRPYVRDVEQTGLPTGIDCDGGCSAPFAIGTQITLTLTPAAGGETFSGWTGPCSGTDACVFTIMDTAMVGHAVMITCPRVTQTFNFTGAVQMLSRPQCVGLIRSGVRKPPVLQHSERPRSVPVVKADESSWR